MCELLAKPILGIITNCSNGLFKAISDYFFSCCAHAKIEVIVIYIVIILGCIYYFPVIKDVILGIKDTKKEYKTYIELEEKLNNISNDSSKDVLVKSGDNKTIENEKKDLFEDIKNGKKQVKRFYWIYIILSALIVVYFFIFTVFNIAPCFCRMSFDEAITKITPYVEQQDIDMLKSDWVQMETQNDFNKIDTFIKDIIKKNNLN